MSVHSSTTSKCIVVEVEIKVRSRRSSWVLQAIILLVSLLGMGLSTAQATSTCKTIFQQKKYVKAGRCFLQQAQKMGKTKLLSAPRRWAKGRLLRNAAICYKRAANRSSPRRAAVWREQAMQLWAKYQREKLYENERRKKDAEKNIKALLREIGYTTLTIRLAKGRAKICVKGFHYLHCQTGKLWQAKIRPGTVQISAKGKSKQSYQAQLTLAPGSQMTHAFTFQKSPPKQKPTALSFQVNATPVGAIVMVDGRHRGKTPLQLQLRKAQVRIAISSPCYVTQTFDWKSQEGKKKISAKLLRSPQFMQWKTSLQSSKANALWGWVAFGGGIAAAGLGVVGQVVANSYHDEASSHKKTYTTSQNASEIARAATLYNQSGENGNHWRTVGHIGLGVGIVALGLGLGRLLTLPTTHKPPCAP